MTFHSKPLSRLLSSFGRSGIFRKKKKEEEGGYNYCRICEPGGLIVSKYANHERLMADRLLRFFPRVSLLVRNTSIKISRLSVELHVNRGEFGKNGLKRDGGKSVPEAIGRPPSHSARIWVVILAPVRRGLWPFNGVLIADPRPLARWGGFLTSIPRRCRVGCS